MLKVSVVGAEEVTGEGAWTMSVTASGRLVGGRWVGRGVVLEEGSVGVVRVRFVEGGGRWRRLCCIVRAGGDGGGGGSGQLHGGGEEGVREWPVG